MVIKLLIVRKKNKSSLKEPSRHGKKKTIDISVDYSNKKIGLTSFTSFLSETKHHWILSCLNPPPTPNLFVTKPNRPITNFDLLLHSLVHSFNSRARVMMQ